MPRDFPSYTPKFTLQPRVRFRTLSASFGDGYSQRGKDGLNNRIDEFDLTFELPLSDIVVLRTFLDNHEGHQAFYWTPPDEPRGLFICDGYTGPRQIGREYFSLRFKLNRVFDV